MYVSGIGSVTTMRIAGYQAQALQAVDRSAARLAANRRFTSFAEDSVAATKEISLRAQQGALGIYLRATQDAASAADAASSGLQEASDILIQLKNAVLALDPDDPTSVSATQATVDELTAELTRIGQTTTSVAGKNLLNGDLVGSPLKFTVGRSGSASDVVELTAIAVNSATLGSTDLDLFLDEIDFNGGATNKDDALDAIDAAQSAIANSLASTAGVSSAMSHQVNAVTAQSGAIDTAIDNLVGVDVAQETVAMTQNQIRAETAAALLSQVNALHVSMVRQLLMGQ